MTFTYTGDPAGSTRDKVRFLLQDVDSTNYHLQDEEIAWLVTEWENIYDVAAAGADIIAGSYAHKADYSKSVGDLSLQESFSKQSERFTELAKQIRATKDRRYTVGWVANTQALQSTEDRIVDNYNTDAFMGQFDNPRGSSEGTGIN